MPIYEYKCIECGHEMDHFHRSRKEPKPPCKACGQDSLEKLISLTSFQLKGNGWYVTDHRGAGQPPVPAPPKSEDHSEKSSSDSAESSTSTESTSKSNDGGAKEESAPKKEAETKSSSEDKKTPKDKVAA